MAAGWMVLLKTVPWADVISGAPAVAESARKLWTSVRGRQTVEHADEQAAEVLKTDPLAAFELRMTASDESVAELQAQMAKTSELLAALADQNNMLIARAEADRRRLIQLMAVSGASLGAALLSLFISARSYFS